MEPEDRPKAGREVPDEAEYYTDAISGQRRRIRGRRKSRSRGPYSLEEKNMIRAFDRLLVAERYMDGELAQPTCVDITLYLTMARRVCEAYSYENVPDVTGIDPHVVAKEMDLMPYDPPAPVPQEEPDIYEDIRDALS